MRKTILAMIKDEQRYLPEWLNYHFNLGFDHIYLVEDFNSSDHADMLMPWKGRVSLHRCDRDLGINDIPRNRTPWRQVWLYNVFFKTYAKEAMNNWCLFLDIDEFFCISDGYTLESLIQEISDEREPKDRGFAFFALRNFNADGRIFEPEMPMKDAYTNWVYEAHGFLCKTFIDVSKPYTFDCIQRGYPNPTTTSKKEHIVERERAWINHYFTKSWEGWLVRMRRGSQDPNLRRLEQFFDLYNPDLLYLKDYLVNEYRKYEKEWMAGGTQFISNDYEERLKSLGYDVTKV